MLGDKAKREQYDQFGTTGGPGGGFPGGNPFAGGGAGGSPFGNVNPEDLSDLFRQFGGMGGMGGEGGGIHIDPEELFGGRRTRTGRARRSAQSVEVETEATIPFETAAQGGSITIGFDDRELAVKVPAGVEEGQRLRAGRPGAGRGRHLCPAARRAAPVFPPRGQGHCSGSADSRCRRRCWARKSTCRRWTAPG